MRYPHRTTITIPAAQKDAANAYFKAHIDREGGENTFTVGWSADGKEPITHYVCSCSLTERQLAKLLDYLDDSANKEALTKEQKVAWIEANQTKKNISVLRDDSNKEWRKPDGKLKPIADKL